MNEEAELLAEDQPVVFRQLQNSFKHGRLSHAYLFEGDPGTGKNQMALWFIKHLFCTDIKDGLPCEKCNNCLRITQHEHPDVVEVAPDGRTIKVDQIRQLQQELAKSGFESSKKVVLIHEAEKMTSNSANSLLKFLEEPPKDFMIILLTSAPGKILPTIHSRTQNIHFQAWQQQKIIKKLEKEQHLTTETSHLLTSLTGSYQKAVEILNDEWFNDAKEVVIQWFHYLEKKDPQGFVYVQKKLVKLFKDKDQQQYAFQMLSYLVRRKRNLLLAEQDPAAGEYNQLLEDALLASQKLTANVSFQNVAEQITLHVVF